MRAGMMMGCTTMRMRWELPDDLDPDPEALEGGAFIVTYPRWVFTTFQTWEVGGHFRISKSRTIASIHETDRGLQALPSFPIAGRSCVEEGD
jgi:hypothetical protein